jgi:hypothetical protein
MRMEVAENHDVLVGLLAMSNFGLFCRSICYLIITSVHFFHITSIIRCVVSSRTSNSCAVFPCHACRDQLDRGLNAWRVSRN